jgi:hypothetical protein
MELSSQRFGQTLPVNGSVLAVPRSPDIQQDQVERIAELIDVHLELTSDVSFARPAACSAFEC